MANANRCRREIAPSWKQGADGRLEPHAAVGHPRMTRLVVAMTLVKDARSNTVDSSAGGASAAYVSRPNDLPDRPGASSHSAGGGRERAA
jgi:hypothetical protein